MSLFVLDTAGDQKLLKRQPHLKSITKVKRARLPLIDKQRRVQKKLTATLKADPEDADGDNDNADDGDYFGLPPPNINLSSIIESTLLKTARNKTKAEREMERLNELVDTTVENAHKRPKFKRGLVTELDYSNCNALTGKFDDKQLVQIDVNKEMAKSTLVPGLEQLKDLASHTDRKQKKLNKLERSKTKGAGWFNLPATEVTEEVQNELKIIQMRSVLDPKHFYKKNDLKVLPKYFQIGTVQHSPLDYYNERGTRINKKKSLVEELLADTNAMSYTKKKYKDIIMRKDKYAHRKAMKKMKKLKKNK